MASVADWIEGARPRTLPAAIAPVLAGTGVAQWLDRTDLLRAGLALVIALALQIGVNFANDYSDGIRGTDADRVGPQRLVGSGAATPAVVKGAAFASFGIAALAGIAVVALCGQWWLLGVGAAAILAAWFYTGGPKPYGYLGLGELFVFVFFGLVAVAGTTYVQAGQVPLAGWLAAVTIGLLACAILVANNLRDIAGDLRAGKRTLATRLGDKGTRVLLLALFVLAGAGIVAIAATSTWWALLGLALVPLAVPVFRRVIAGAVGRDLIVVLRNIGLAELVAALGLCIGLTVG